MTTRLSFRGGREQHKHPAVCILVGPDPGSQPPSWSFRVGPGTVLAPRWGFGVGRIPCRAELQGRDHPSLRTSCPWAPGPISACTWPSPGFRSRAGAGEAAPPSAEGTKVSRSGATRHERHHLCLCPSWACGTCQPQASLRQGHPLACREGLRRLLEVSAEARWWRVTRTLHTRDAQWRRQSGALLSPSLRPW